MAEANFRSRRRVVFYNTRSDEVVFAIEGYIHVAIDRDGDIELVIKVGEQQYLRDYLGKNMNMVYFSEELMPCEVDSYAYKIVWNPNNWIPVFDTEL